LSNWAFPLIWSIVRSQDLSLPVRKAEREVLALSFNQCGSLLGS